MRSHFIDAELPVCRTPLRWLTVGAAQHDVITDISDLGRVAAGFVELHRLRWREGMGGAEHRIKKD